MKETVKVFTSYEAHINENGIFLFRSGIPYVNLKGNISVDRQDCPDRDTERGEPVIREEGDVLTVYYPVKSTAWEEKTVTFRLTEEGVSADATLRGKGRVGEVRFFEGKREKEPEKYSSGSAYEFTAYTVPFTDFFSKEHVTRNVTEGFSFDFQIFCPPLYVFSFRHPEDDVRLGMAMYGKEGDWNFIRYDYVPASGFNQSGFYLSTDFEEHRLVDGTFTTPTLEIYFAQDDMGVFREYADRYRRRHPGLPGAPKAEEIPRFWYGPIACGWREQYVEGARAGIGADQCASEEVYRRFVDRIMGASLSPKILIIDDKWQREYGSAYPDPEKWQDMRGFIDEMHDRGIHTLLWYKLWAGNGLPDDEIIKESDPTPYGTWTFDESPYCDPSSPAFAKRLRERIRILLSDEEGCFNADGFKIDFAFMMPRGKKARSYDGSYGVELYRRQMELIYRYAKEIKPHCLINASICNPYFAGLCDQLRLHDYDDSMRDYRREFTYRRDIFGLALPGLLIDTDSPCYGSVYATMNALRFQPQIGVPDLYRISGDERCEFSEENLREIKEIWERYESTLPDGR